MKKLMWLFPFVLILSACATQGVVVNGRPKQVTYKQISETIRGQLTPTCQDLWLEELHRGIEADDLEMCITQLVNGATPEDIRERAHR